MLIDALFMDCGLYWEKVMGRERYEEGIFKRIAMSKLKNRDIEIEISKEIEAHLNQDSHRFVSLKKDLKIMF